jgi:uncharacterized protein YggE
MKNIVTLLCALIVVMTTAHAAPLTDGSLGIQASGQCLKKVSQDRGAIVVTTSIVASTPKDASERATKAHERVRSAIANLKLQDSQTETINYSINEECSYENNRRNCRGFRATYASRFETSEIARIGEAIGAAAQSSSEEVSQLQTFVSPTRLKAERESCLEVASQDAAAKALKLARGAGVKLGRLTALAEQPEAGNVSPYMPRVAYAMEASSDAEMATPAIESKPVDLEVSVRATYAIE